jgi:8-oxo-dGTP pyrophosphatase MutT (NUDIX family)
MNFAGAGFILLASDLSTLVVHDARSGKWGPPKGHREDYDADDLATAVRECREETGLTPEDYTVLPDVFKISKGSQSYLFRYAILKDDAYKTRVVAGPIGEISDVRWVPLVQLLDAATVLDGNKYLRTWISDIKGNVSKKHVHLFKSLCTRLLPLHESVGASNVVTCS